MKKRQEGRINEELVTIDSLVYSLKKDYGFTKITVKDPEDEPPDFWMTIDKNIYAVEITSIVSAQP